MSSGGRLAQALELLVDDHRADAVVREHLHQQRAVDRERQDVRALDAAAAGAHAVLQVEAGVGRHLRRGQRREQPLGVGERELGVDRRFRVGRVLADARHLGDEQQLVGLQGDRRARRDVFHRQVERLAGRREAERREQQHRADVDRAPDRRRVDLADDAAVHEVDAVDDADRPRGQEVARDDADDGVGHRRVRQALRERRLDLEAQLAGGLLGAVERDRVGDAHAVAVARLVALRAQLLVDLRPKAVHEDELDAHRLQDRQVLGERGELAGGDQLAGDRDHEGLAVVGVDVRRHGAEPRHEGVREDQVHGRWRGERKGGAILAWHRRARPQGRSSRGSDGYL